MYVINMHTDNQVCKNTKQYLDFWLCNGQKTGEGDDITFVERNLWRFLLLYVKRYDIFGILR